MIEIESWTFLAKEAEIEEPFFIVRNTLNNKESFIPYDLDDLSFYNLVIKILASKPRKKWYKHLSIMANMELECFIDWKPYGQHHNTIQVNK